MVQPCSFMRNPGYDLFFIWLLV